MHSSSSLASSNIRRGSDASIDRLSSFGGVQYSDGFRSKRLASVKRFLDKHGLFQLWNEIFVFLCIVSVSIDPLFCYILVIDENNKCVGWDRKLKIIVVVLRSLTDMIYALLLGFHLCCRPVSPPPSELGAWALVNKYRSSRLPIDVLSALPLPQVIFLLVIPKLWSSSLWIVVRSLKFILFIQFVPRVLRIYGFLKKITWATGLFAESSGAKAVLNLFLYMLASHVFGAFWYMFSIERKISCWQGTCFKHTRQPCTLSCDRNWINTSFLNGSCVDYSRIVGGDYNFGIFAAALESGIVNSKEFVQKISFCYWWGLRNLSCLGQNLKTSTFIWEIYFAALISTSGLLLFAFLIGNLQTYLRTRIARLEEMRVKGEDIELWMAFHSLPRNLKTQIKKYERFKWRSTKGIDIESLLIDLPRDLRRDIKRHLCQIPITRVPTLRNMDQNLVDAIYDHLKPMLYIDHTFIVREGDPLDEMIFIVRGQILTYSAGMRNSTMEYLEKGQFYGADLLDWALSTPSGVTSVPTSTKTVTAHTKVEAFVLRAHDLKILVSKFWWLFSRELGHCPNFRQNWTPFAALILQSAWRRYSRNKAKTTNRTDKEGESSSSSRTTVQMSRLLNQVRTGLKKANKGSTDSSRV